MPDTADGTAGVPPAVPSEVPPLPSEVRSEVRPEVRPAVPPLPPVRGAGVAHVIIPGTALWFVAFVVLLIGIPTLRSHDAMGWLWTSLAGWLLGFVGLAIYGWQRAAARRGSRGANRLALDEKIGSPEGA